MSTLKDVEHQLNQAMQACQIQGDVSKKTIASFGYALGHLAVNHEQMEKLCEFRDSIVAFLTTRTIEKIYLQRPPDQELAAGAWSSLEQSRVIIASRPLNSMGRLMLR